jgi:bifunctional non-homologous end joining protein LigD
MHLRNARGFRRFLADPSGRADQRNESGLQRPRRPGASGVKAPFPDFIKPALVSWMDRVPSGERWIHEIKFDGYRVQLHLANEAVPVYTRRG